MVRPLARWASDVDHAMLTKRWYEKSAFDETVNRVLTLDNDQQGDFRITSFPCSK